ncbi:MAG: hypothetical protein RLZZ262_1841, partial [Bacteroidota bacterium]
MNYQPVWSTNFPFAPSVFGPTIGQHSTIWHLLQLHKRQNTLTQGGIQAISRKTRSGVLVVGFLLNFRELTALTKLLTTYMNSRLNQLLNIALIGILSLLYSNSFSQCDDPLNFTQQDELDQFFLDNPTCVHLGDVTITNGNGGDEITNLDAFSNVEFIESLTILDYNVNMDVSGLSNLTDLWSLSGFMLKDYSFCANITNIDYLNIEYYGFYDPNFDFYGTVDLEGFDGLQWADHINICIDIEMGAEIDIFPNLTELNTLSFDTPLSSYTQIDYFSGFHALESIELIYFDYFHFNVLEIGNSLETITTLDYNYTGTEDFVSFINVHTISDCNIISAGYNWITLPALQECSSADFQLDGWESFNFPMLHTVSNLSINFGEIYYPQGSYWDPTINIPLLTSCNNFTLDGDHLSSSNVLAPININFNSLATVSNNFKLHSTLLEDLSAFPSLVTIGNDLRIIDNPELSYCSIDVICNKLNAAPNDVTITGNSGYCAEVGDVAIACAIPTISGQVYYDINCNQTFDADDIDIPYPLIMDNASNFIGATSANGNYVIVAPPNGLLTFVPVPQPGA